LAFEDEETGEMLPPHGPEPPKQPSAKAVEGLWQDVLPESQAPAAPTPPATFSPWGDQAAAEMGQGEAFRDQALAQGGVDAGQQQGGQGGEDAVNVLKDILKACEGIEGATAKNAEEIRSLKDALDGLGTFGP
jgi:hypothetical protein